MEAQEAEEAQAPHPASPLLRQAKAAHLSDREAEFRRHDLLLPRRQALEVLQEAPSRPATSVVGGGEPHAVHCRSGAPSERQAVNEPSSASSMAEETPGDPALSPGSPATDRASPGASAPANRMRRGRTPCEVTYNPIRWTARVPEGALACKRRLSSHAPSCWPRASGRRRSCSALGRQEEARAWRPPSARVTRDRRLGGRRVAGATRDPARTDACDAKQ